MTSECEKIGFASGCSPCQITLLGKQIDGINYMLSNLNPYLHETLKKDRIFSLISDLKLEMKLQCENIKYKEFVKHSTKCKSKDIQNTVHKTEDSKRFRKLSMVKGETKGHSTSMINHQCSELAKWIVDCAIYSTVYRFDLPGGSTNVLANITTETSSQGTESLTKQEESCKGGEINIEKNESDEIKIVGEIYNKASTDENATKIRNRTVLEKVPDVDELEELYARIPSLKSRPPREEVEFISLDEKENQDNTDTRWSELKKLGTDNELHTFARAAFGNKEFSNPNRCLSFQGFKRKEEYKRNQVTLPRYRVHQDIKIDKGRIIKCNWWQSTSDDQDRKRKATADPEEMPPAKRQKLITFDQYEKAMRRELMEQMKINSKEKRMKYWLYSVRHFKKSMQETKSFLKMYSNQREKDDEKVYMTEEELKANCCVELIFSQFVQYYGPNPVRKCNDCSDMDNEAVHHPY